MPLDGQVFGTTSVALHATITDDSATTVSSTPAGVSASLPAGGGAVDGNVPLQVEGDNVLSVSATDDAGNLGGSSVTVVRDTTPPLVDVLSPPEGAVLGTDPATFTAGVTDATATTLVFAGNTLAFAAGGGQASGPVDLIPGENAISFTATDAAGHVTVATRHVVLDLEAPVIAIDTPADGTCFGPGESPCP